MSESTNPEGKMDIDEEQLFEDDSPEMPTLQFNFDDDNSEDSNELLSKNNAKSGNIDEDKLLETTDDVETDKAKKSTEEELNINEDKLLADDIESSEDKSLHGKEAEIDEDELLETIDEIAKVKKKSSTEDVDEEKLLETVDEEIETIKEKITAEEEMKIDEDKLLETIDETSIAKEKISTEEEIKIDEEKLLETIDDIEITKEKISTEEEMKIDEEKLLETIDKEIETIEEKIPAEEEMKIDEEQLLEISTGIDTEKISAEEEKSKLERVGGESIASEKKEAEDEENLLEMKVDAPNEVNISMEDEEKLLEPVEEPDDKKTKDDTDKIYDNAQPAKSDVTIKETSTNIPENASSSSVPQSRASSPGHNGDSSDEFENIDALGLLTETVDQAGHISDEDDEDDEEPDDDDHSVDRPEPDNDEDDNDYVPDEDAEGDMSSQDDHDEDEPMPSGDESSQPAIIPHIRDYQDADPEEHIFDHLDSENSNAAFSESNQDESLPSMSISNITTLAPEAPKISEDIDDVSLCISSVTSGVLIETPETSQDATPSISEITSGIQKETSKTTEETDEASPCVADVMSGIQEETPEILKGSDEVALCISAVTSEIQTETTEQPDKITEESMEIDESLPTLDDEPTKSPEVEASKADDAVLCEPSEKPDDDGSETVDNAQKLRSELSADQAEKLEKLEKTFEDLIASEKESTSVSSESKKLDDIAKSTTSPAKDVSCSYAMDISMDDKSEDDKTIKVQSQVRNLTPKVEPKTPRKELQNRVADVILSLDSDDDLEPPEAPIISKEVVLKSPSKKPKCAHTWCESDESVPVSPCPNFALSLYKIKSKNKSMCRPSICDVCLAKAVDHMSDITSKLRCSKSIFHQGFAKVDNQIQVLDSDSDEEVEEVNQKIFKNRFKEKDLSDEVKTFLLDDLLVVVEDTWVKYDLQDSIKLYENDLDGYIETVKDDAAKFKSELDQLQNETDELRKTFYDLFKAPTSQLSPLIIPSEWDEKEVPFQFAVLGDPSKVPPDGPLDAPPLKPGESVYAMKMSVFGAWAAATVEEVWPKGTQLANGQSSTFSMLKVKFTTTDEDSLKSVKQVTGRQVAYFTPAKVRYPVGARVIALFKESNESTKKLSYYSGIIAETASVINSYRYLIFFDDGYSQYVLHNDVLRLYEWSPRVWDDVHPDSRDFIRKYLMTYPDRPMVRLKTAQRLKVSHNGKWCQAKVIAVDSSLVLIGLLGLTDSVYLKQWIYRGSTRLLPLFQELSAADKRTHIRQRQTGANNRNGLPYVEYTRTNDAPIPELVSIDSTSKPTRSVAKKSTTLRNESIPIPSPQKVEQTIETAKSRVVYYSPKTDLKPKTMVPHECSSECVDPRAMPLSKLKAYNPLIRPLLNGWERLIMKYKSKRAIVYRTPCGRCVRCPNELHQYLRSIESDMSVDLFDFDPWVHCLAEFVHAKCLVSKRDISHGVEAVPIPCVNSYDNTLPQFCSYSTRRIPTEGVNLNLDEEFLCGCDCTDDCQDKTKCQCWQMTLEGAKLVRMDPETVGYQHKRLLNNVSTGIYECNSRCKCAMTCLNRVVQHPLQHKLQVFKTVNRGWGIRTMNDLPKGAFICVYAGNLLTDAVANVDGVNEGDEYLAELDYIEVVEKIKESYESDIPEEDKLLDEEESEEDIKEEPDDTDDRRKEDEDEDFRPDTYVPTVRENNEITTRLRTKKQKRKSEIQTTSETPAKISKTGENPQGTNKKPNDGSIMISDDEDAAPDRLPSSFAAPEGLLDDDDDYVPKHKSVRSFFGPDEACFIMDAKVQGNLGRYLNHSCAPNVFVQNVLVDTHDPRFPWVAFFTLNHIRAGTELTWNYNYEVGSVSGKVMYCRCGAPNCRGRLL